MKEIILLILLLLNSIQSKSSRLLQSETCRTRECLDPNGLCAPVFNCLVNPCSINNGGCKEICTANYCGGCHAVCSCKDPNQCINPQTHKCDNMVRCLVDPCANNNGGCYSDQKCHASYCGGCHAICSPPAAGDLCGWPPDDCTAYRCGCNLCPDGKTKYGCCAMSDGCSWEYDIDNCALECSGIIPYERACVGCDINHCIEYFDGCNDCKCGKDNNIACTKTYCFVYDAPKCTKCETGYVINPTTNICEKKVGCSIDHCMDYYDGCNLCHCSDNGSAVCTLTACMCQGISKCMKCEFGYYLNENDKCIQKKKCKRGRDCDRTNRFWCEIDPVCEEMNVYEECQSNPKPNVCVNINSQCISNDDCDVKDGFLCVGEKNNGGVCVKYQPF